MRVCQAPNEALTKASKLIGRGDRTQLTALLSLMYKTMLNHNGVGIAANQIGINKQVALVSIGDRNSIEPLQSMDEETFNSFLYNNHLLIINPLLIVPPEASIHMMTEGCLSIKSRSQLKKLIHNFSSKVYPNITKNNPVMRVPRYDRVKLSIENREGLRREFLVLNDAAHRVQHEVDHLNGKLYTDRINNLYPEYKSSWFVDADSHIDFWETAQLEQNIKLELLKL